MCDLYFLNLIANIYVDYIFIIFFLTPFHEVFLNSNFKLMYYHISFFNLIEINYFSFDIIINFDYKQFSSK